MIGDNIKSLRKSRGFTQAELGKMINVSNKTICSWEINRTEPNMGDIENLAIAFECRKAEILGEVDYLSYEEHTLIVEYRKASNERRDSVRLLLGLKKED